MTEPFSDPIPGGTLPDGEQVYSPKMISQSVARKFVSLRGAGYVAMAILGPDGPVDADINTLALKVYFNPLDGTATTELGAQIVDVGTDDIAHDDLGKYSYNIGPQHTGQKGLLTAEWTYAVNDVTFTFMDYMEILDAMPMWDSLRDDTRFIVEQMSWHFGDLFDSTVGGPWLKENFQTHFNYERMAFLLGQAVMKFNVLAFPVTNYGVTADSPAIPDNYNSLMVWGGKLEVIRHLMLSYTEQPDFRNMQTTYTDRRDYMQRWKDILEEEKPEYERAVKLAKRDLLSLSRGSLLVGGGIYSTSARGFFVAGMYASQTRAFRFYPAAPSMMWASQAFGR